MVIFSVYAKIFPGRIILCQMSRWRPVLALSAIILGWVVCWAAAKDGRIQPIHDESDLTDYYFYQSVAEKVGAGADYYDVAAIELPRFGFPTGSPFNWRTPLYAHVLGRLGGTVANQVALATLASVAAALAAILAGRSLGAVAAGCRRDFCRGVVRLVGRSRATLLHRDMGWFVDSHSDRVPGPRFHQNVIPLWRGGSFLPRVGFAVRWAVLRASRRATANPRGDRMGGLPVTLFRPPCGTYHLCGEPSYVSTWRICFRVGQLWRPRFRTGNDSYELCAMAPARLVRRYLPAYGDLRLGRSGGEEYGRSMGSDRDQRLLHRLRCRRQRLQLLLGLDYIADARLGFRHRPILFDEAHPSITRARGARRVCVEGRGENGF